jgi:flagellar biosynthetic protein FliR
MRIAFDAAWAAGLLFALSRTAGFAIASPLFARALPPLGRVAFAIGAALFLAVPVPATPSLGEVVTWTFVNVAVGLVLAFVSGLILYLFEVAGEVLDLTSGMGAAHLIDPMTKRSEGPFARLFRMTAFALFLALGGDRLIVQALSRSTDAIPLAGGMRMPPGVGDSVVGQIGSLMLAAIELVAPALAALVLAEIALGLTARFVPQVNVFLLGLPGKLLITFAVLGAVIALFPGTVQGAIDTMLDTFGGLLHALGPG